MIPSVSIEFVDETSFSANRRIKGRRRISEMHQKAKSGKDNKSNQSEEKDTQK
jgi:hypothetical protein